MILFGLCPTNQPKRIYRYQNKKGAPCALGREIPERVTKINSYDIFKYLLSMMAINYSPCTAYPCQQSLMAKNGGKS